MFRKISCLIVIGIMHQAFVYRKDERTIAETVGGEAGIAFVKKIPITDGRERDTIGAPGDDNAPATEQFGKKNRQYCVKSSELADEEFCGKAMPEEEKELT